MKPPRIFSSPRVAGELLSFSYTHTINIREMAREGESQRNRKSARIGELERKSLRKKEQKQTEIYFLIFDFFLAVILLIPLAVPLQDPLVVQALHVPAYHRKAMKTSTKTILFPPMKIRLDCHTFH